MNSEEEIDKLIRDACNSALKAGAPPEDVADACLVHGIGLATRVTSPAEVARLLMDNAERLLDQAKQGRGQRVLTVKH